MTRGENEQNLYWLVARNDLRGDANRGSVSLSRAVDTWYLLCAGNMQQRSPCYPGYTGGGKKNLDLTGTS